MKLPVLVEPLGTRFVATAVSPFCWKAEGATAVEAVANLQLEAKRHASNGYTVAEIEVNGTGNPWLDCIGTWEDEPMIDEFNRAVEEYRESVDTDADVM